MRDAGRVKTLAVFADERLEQFSDVPTTEEATGVAGVGGTWRGIVVPAGTPDDVVDTLQTALKDVYDSAEFQDFMTARGFGMRWLPADEFGQFAADAATSNAAVIEKLGLRQ